MEKKIKFSRNVQHLHVKCGNDNESDTDKRITDESTQTVHKDESDENVRTVKSSGQPSSALKRLDSDKN